MCNQGNQFVFCMCGSEEELLESDYVWVLTRLVGLKEGKFVGKILPPSNNLGNGVTPENLVGQLNQSNIFDFEYQPNENDSLRISFQKTGELKQYFTLIYRDNKWQSGRNPLFSSIVEQIAKGKIKY
jgi:hypothetical protein